MVLCRLLKIFKIAKLAQLTAPLEAVFGSAQVAFARLIFTFIAIFHGTACGFHLMSFLSYSQGSWIETQDLDEAKVFHRCLLLPCHQCQHAWCLQWMPSLLVQRKACAGLVPVLLWALWNCCSMDEEERNRADQKESARACVHTTSPAVGGGSFATTRDHGHGHA